MNIVTKVNSWFRVGSTCLLFAMFGYACSKKEAPHSTLVAALPDSGILSTNFVVPYSKYVTLLIAYPGVNPSIIEGEFKLIGDNKTTSLSVSKNSEAANYLGHLGLNSIRVNRYSLTDKRFPDGPYLFGSKCQILVTLTNAPKNSSVYLHYLK